MSLKKGVKLANPAHIPCQQTTYLQQGPNRSFNTPFLLILCIKGAEELWRQTKTARHSINHYLHSVVGPYDMFGLLMAMEPMLQDGRYKPEARYILLRLLGDVDGDGWVEVIVGSYDKYVWAFNCPGSYDAGSFPWTTFQHDVLRTGLYPVPGAPFPSLFFLFLILLQQQQASQFMFFAGVGVAALLIVALVVGFLWWRRK